MKSDIKPGTYLFPVPVVMVSCGQLGIDANIITIAWVGTVASKPPQIGISIRPSRFSYGLIKRDQEFAINLPTRELLNRLDYCGLHSGEDVDKFKETGLTPVQGKVIKSIVIKEAPINLECRLLEEISLGSHDLFIGEVVYGEAKEELLNQSGGVNFKDFKAMAYMGGDYWSLGEVIGSFGCSNT